MKKFGTLLTIAFFVACSGNKGESGQAVDTTAVEPQAETVYEEEGGGAYDPNTSPYPELQARVVALEQEFKAFRKTADSLVFETSYEMEGGRFGYYFSGKELKFVSHLKTAEGGYAEQALLKVGTQGVTGYNLTTETAGHFAYEQDGSIMSAEVRYGTQFPGTPVVRQNHSESGFTYYEPMNNQLSALFDKLGNFKKVGKVYEWYQRKEKTTSEYGGDVEVVEVYRMSPNLYKTDFLPTNAIKTDALGKFEGLWHLLTATNNGYEWRTVCGAGRGIEIASSDGDGRIPFSWVDRDINSAWKASIIGFAEGEGDSYKVTLNPSGGNEFQVLVFDEKQKLLFINGQPYTQTPNGYPVVDSGKDCGN